MMTRSARHAGTTLSLHIYKWHKCRCALEPNPQILLYTEWANTT
jgi:hypothetical protein